MSSKSFLAIVFVTATAIVSANPASADPVAGAAIGAGVGAVAGHAISGRDGALVGGAALKASDFLGIIRAIPA